MILLIFRPTWNMKSLMEIQLEFKFCMNVWSQNFLYLEISGLVILSTWTKPWRFSCNLIFFSILALVVYSFILLLQTARIVRDVYCRATRNCPWVGELWVRYLISLERGHAPEEDISAVSFCYLLSDCFPGWSLILYKMRIEICNSIIRKNSLTLHTSFSFTLGLNNDNVTC